MISYVAAKLSDTGTLGKESYGWWVRPQNLNPMTMQVRYRKGFLWVRIVRYSYSTVHTNPPSLLLPTQAKPI